MIACKMLIPLQELDLKLDAFNAEIAEKKQKVVKMQNDVEEEVKLNDKKLALLKKIKLRKQQAETSLKEIETKLNDIGLKMRSAGVKPTVYNALEKEFKTLESNKDQIETKILEDIEKIEKLQADTDKGTKFTGGRKEHLALVKQRVSEEIIGIKKQAELVKTERQQNSLSVDSQALIKYQELRDKKGGKVLFGIDKPSCPKCGMAFHGGFANMIKSHDEGELCSNCGVILYWTGSRE